jgi:hypothetical protein
MKRKILKMMKPEKMIRNPKHNKDSFMLKSNKIKII